VRKRAGKIITDSTPLGTTFNNLNWCLPAAGDSDSRHKNRFFPQADPPS